MTEKIWWLIQKDMHSECRAARAWPIMLLMGVVVALILGFQLDRLPAERTEMVGGIFWLAVFFAGTVAMEHSFRKTSWLPIAAPTESVAPWSRAPRRNRRPAFCARRQLVTSTNFRVTLT